MADEDLKSIAQSAEDATAFPVLTEEISPTYPTQRPSALGAPAGTPLGALAESAIRDVLGWRPRPNDPKGFLAALNQSFSCAEVSGVRRCYWTPRGYAAQADLGAVTGAQASIYTRAKGALDQALPLLDGLTPLTAFADEQDVDAIRAIIRSDLVALVAELGVEGGSTVVRVDDFFESLIGLRPGDPNVDDPEQVGGRISILRDRFGLERQNVNTIEEELNFTNFLVLVDHVNGLKRSWDFVRPFFATPDEVEPFLGTQLVLLSRELGVVAESVHELYFAMDSVFLGAAERETTVLELDGQPPITVAELLGWVDRFASEEGPRLIQDAGKDGVTAAEQTLSKLADLVELAFELSRNPRANPVRGFHTARVQRAFEELSGELDRAEELAERVRRSRPVIDFVEPPQAIAASETRLTIDGDNFEPGAAVELEHNRTKIKGLRVTFVSETELKAVFDLRGEETGAWTVVVRNPDGGEDQKDDVFAVSPASESTITELKPNEETRLPRKDKSVNVEVIGTGFVAPVSFAPVEDVELRAIQVTPTKVTARMTIKKGARAGPRKIVLRNGDRQRVQAEFTIKA